MGSLGNTMCYLGITEKRLCIAVMGQMTVKRVNDMVIVDLDDIGNVRKGGMMPGQVVLHFDYGDFKADLSMMKHPLYSKIRNQKKDVERIEWIMTHIDEYLKEQDRKSAE